MRFAEPSFSAAPSPQIPNCCLHLRALLLFFHSFPPSPPMTDPTTTPTPPQGLADEQLRDVLWKCLCERKANESPFGAGSSSESNMQARMDDCRAAIAADRAQRSQTEKAIDLIHLVEAGIRFGYMAGHNDTVEACYGDPASIAEDYAAETLRDALSSLHHRPAACLTPAPVLLTPAQLEKLQEILTDYCDKGPPGQGWASAELSKIRAIVDTWHAQPAHAPELMEFAAPPRTTGSFTVPNHEQLNRAATLLEQAATLLEQFGLNGWIVPTVEEITPTPEEVEARAQAKRQEAP